ncbi:MAG: hypothetical protein KTR29_20175 [Rhodothermaceae bacterium]|nr:hypothetical protein [Rhodothermaceae bacterium]
MKPGVTYLFYLLFVLVQNPLLGQDRPLHEVEGKPFNTQHFIDQSPEFSNENWDVVQHPNGLLYVANQSGVLEFDGHNWRLIELPGKNSVFALGIDENGRIYVGARGDFGKLVPNAVGMLEFESMLDLVREEERDFRNIWGVHVTSSGVVFQANNYLFRWDGNQIWSLSSDDRLHTSFGLFDRFFVKKDGVGLLELIGDSLHVVSGGAQFADQRVFMMEPMLDGSIMIGAQEGVDGPLNLFKFSESGLTKFITDPHLTSVDEVYTYYGGTKIRDGYYAIASLYDGVFIVDANGRLVETFRSDRTIPGDVTSVYKDFQGGLWITHYTNGITHIGAPFSLSEYDLPGSLVNDIVRYEGKLFVATDEGLFTLKDRRSLDESDPENRFDLVEVESTTKMRFSLHAFDDQLLVATEMGIYSMVDDEASLVAFDYLHKPKLFIDSHAYPGRVYVGMETGLGIMTYANGVWDWEKVDTHTQPVTSMVEGPDGALWFSRKGINSEVWRMEFDDQGRVADEKRIADHEELNAAELEVDLIAGDIGVIALPLGIFRARADRTGAYKLGIDSTLTGSVADTLLYAFSADPQNYWTVYPNNLVLNTLSEDGKIERRSPQILQFSNLNKIDHVFVDNDQAIWLGDKDRLLKFKPKYAHLDETSYTQDLIIRSVSLAWSDSVLYAGEKERLGEDAEGELDIRLVYEDNDLQFEFAVPDFYRLGEIEYRYKIDGFEKGWSEWTSDNHAVYRNVDPGNHELIVRARSGDEYFDTEARLPFSILPPWYATWWMKLAYVSLALLGVLFMVRYSNAKKRLSILEQEREWYDRIRLANNQLRTANSSLEQANKMKDEFLANASHELRTPLTAILGFTSVLKEELLDEHQEFAGLIDENGKRLLKTINSLLDLAKLRAGTIQLDMKPLEVNAKVEQVLDLLAQLAKNQSIALTISKSPGRVFVLLDEHSFERVLYNLIGNAIKFTPAGSVDVEIKPEPDKVSIHVRDTGIGIDEAFIPYLFDEFKQEPSVEVHSDGSGLGLAISAKLVDMMNGKIEVDSQKGVGSTFTVIFPVKYVELPNGDEESLPDNNSETSFKSTI